MAAATAHNILRRNQSLLRLPKSARSKHSLPDPPVEAPQKISNLLPHRLQQSKWWCSLFPPSISRKCKHLDPSTSTILSQKSGFVSWYLGMIKTRPIATKSCTAALIYTAADATSQMIAGGNGEGYDWLRSLRMGGYGMIIAGPSLHFWFNFAYRVFPRSDLFSTFAKMALGQVVYGPIATTLFFSVNAALQGESGSEIVGRLKRDVVPTMLRGAMYWPVCDFITFKFIPLHLQPLVSNGFAYVWTIYLTYMASLEKVDEVRP